MHGRKRSRKSAKHNERIWGNRSFPERSSWYGNTGVCWLEPGTYYCVIPAWGPQGRYIESEVAYEEILYHCVIQLMSYAAVAMYGLSAAGGKRQPVSAMAAVDAPSKERMAF